MWSTWNYGGDNRQIFDVNIVYYLYIHISSKRMILKQDMTYYNIKLERN